MPETMARRAEESGVKRASTDPVTLLVLSVMAGAFISFGAIFATTSARILPYRVGRFLTGLVRRRSWSCLRKWTSWQKNWVQNMFRLDGLQDINPDSQVSQEIGSVLEALDKLCAK